LPVDARARRAARSIARLVRLMAALRSPRGCPWDRKQTHATLAPFLLEETYEALDTLNRGDFDALPGELGDVLFQCVFHAQLAAEVGRFDLGAAMDGLIAKLIRRHPHVFTTSGRLLPRRRDRRRPTTPSAVLQQWERLKADEQDAAGVRARVLGGVPRSLPALLRAHEIGTRAAAVGFDWPETTSVLDKLDEEVRELREAFHESPARASDEFGDVLFTLANLARKLGIEPEAALRAASDKFTARFDAVEADLHARGASVHGATLETLEAAWERAKSAFSKSV
jgi:ATP diphosphatase